MCQNNYLNVGLKNSTSSVLDVMNSRQRNQQGTFLSFCLSFLNCAEVTHLTFASHTAQKFATDSPAFLTLNLPGTTTLICELQKSVFLYPSTHTKKEILP